MEIRFLGVVLAGVCLGGFFAQEGTGRGFFPVLGCIGGGELPFSAVCALQRAGVDWVPVDCTAEEERDLVAMVGEALEAHVRTAVAAARSRA